MFAQGSGLQRRVAIWTLFDSPAHIAPLNWSALDVTYRGGLQAALDLSHPKILHGDTLSTHEPINHTINTPTKTATVNPTHSPSSKPTPAPAPPSPK